MTFLQEDDNQADAFEEKSKSQIKRELNALKDLAKALVALPKKELERLPIDDSLLDVILQAQTLSHGPLKRELGYIGKCLTDLPHEDIQAQLVQVSAAPVHAEKSQATLWTEALISGDNALLAQLYQDFPSFDGQYVRQLVRNAQKEQRQSKPMKSATTLAHYLASLGDNGVND